MIYLDHASTTKPTDSVINTYIEAQNSLYFNSESLHVGGEIVKDALKNSRQFLKDYFSTNKDIIFTTSGSHANEIAIRMYLMNSHKKNVYISPYEHLSIKAALEPFKQQFNIVDIPLDNNGEIDLQFLNENVDENTALIITQHVSSETGYVLPIFEISEIAKKYHVPLHVDGVQAVKKLDKIDVNLGSSYSFAAHKFHGVKGNGALLIDHSYVQPINENYAHEESARNGTLDVPGIIALIKAVSLDSEFDHLKHLHQHAVKRAEEFCTVLRYKNYAPHILGVLTPKFEGQYVMQSLSNKNIAVSTGTACGHGSLVSDGLKNKILKENGVIDQYIRLSFSKYTTIDELDACFDAIGEILKKE